MLWGASAKYMSIHQMRTNGAAVMRYPILECRAADNLSIQYSSPVGSHR
jgi:hypothetical protein